MTEVQIFWAAVAVVCVLGSVAVRELMGELVKIREGIEALERHYFTVNEHILKRDWEAKMDNLTR